MDGDEFATVSRQLRDRISFLRREMSLEKANPRNSVTRNSRNNDNFDDATEDILGDEIRYLKDENRKLKEELLEAREYIQNLAERNRILIHENRRIPEAEAEVTLLKAQLQAIRKTLDKMPANESAYHLRMEVLEERLQEMQRQNFDLRRQLAGMTPERSKGVEGKNGITGCELCASLRKQKVLQAKYVIAQATENRRQLEEARKECQQLRDSNEELKMKQAEIEAKYKKDLKEATEYRDLYRRLNERSAKWYKTQLDGFTSDINNFKAKLADLEKYLVKAHLNAEADQKQQALIEELKKITIEAAVVADQVKRWRNVYE